MATGIVFMQAGAPTVELVMSPARALFSARRRQGEAHRPQSTVMDKDLFLNVDAVGNFFFTVVALPVP